MARTPGGALSSFTLLSTPDEPTITSITTSIGSASVAFTAPTDVGDAAVSSYVVTAVDESSGVSTGGTGTSSPITVSPPAGGTFKIRMQALNPYGPGRLTEYDTGNAIYSGAELYSWGSGSSGRIGDNTTVSKSSPVQIGALTTWYEISAATCNVSIKTDGTLWGWGYNGSGQIGDNTDINKSSPVQVGALTTWSTVSTESTTTAAIKTSGSLWTWGINNHGQLGQNFQGSARSSPIQVGALTDWSKVSAFKDGEAFVAIKTNGTLWAWGRNNQSKLGDTTSTYRSSPVQIGALTNWSRTTSGERHTIAIKTDGTLWSWGYNNYGQLGNNSITGRASPIQIGALTTWSKSSAGQRHSGAVSSNGSIWTWGRNNFGGQLGQGNSISKSSPTQVGSLTNWLKISMGNNFTLAVKTDGTLWAWGYNTAGQLGDGTAINRSSPVQVGALTSWYEVSGGGTASTLALYGVV